MHQRKGTKQQHIGLASLDNDEHYKQQQKQQQQQQQQQNTPNTPARFVLKLIERVAWIGIGLALAYYTDALNVLLYNPLIDRMYLSIAILFLVTFFAFYFYVAYICGGRHHNSNDWEKLFPKSIKTATVAIVLFTITFMLACWPVWRWFTPVYMLIYTIAVSYLI
ncbi:hypothetical protein SAMD00019534_048300 [Acytostelium subglobosum LB1]|uniref:hypothetical protein n=1 Tax=Acytostelium subglobosum LB1 TaxID=1410327 RepID=UPI000644E879|nr:hypothetical protein SAMD00019534_048300 [Acytostelium subglobosum LB1]GAM21655.1 hypothetical protein SAMD00019534_048300 [Acytostelium subglobosum LB1]|eukprot:XP_012755774.1 hypothetical protein SAMD00019534_048300 [Acytostelium subglobosum LB1]